MRYAPLQRHAFSAALLEVGPDAPTLCEGWTASDLAAHCWVRERQPKALLGIASPKLEHFATDEMKKAQEQHGYVEMAAKLAETPRSPMTAVPALDDAVNTAEYLIHTEDVRRANGLPLRTIDEATQVMLWKRLATIGKLLFRKAGVGIRLEWEGSDAEPLRVAKGDETVTIVGAPAEILLYAFGRKDVADVRLIGTDAGVATLKKAKLGA